ncbi:MAG TPA: selenium cofactor biosynthesis protein YqeC [Holophaga sp.]|nr:selenium cofactor biosynthesis protein YqeC [Holophaga sp.]
MRLTDALQSVLPSPAAGGVIALVGAGGKTRALFGLGEELAEQGHDVLLTTTTHIFDPRLEAGRLFDEVILEGACPWEQVPPRPDRGRRIVFAGCKAPDPGKLRGVEPTRIGELARAGAFLLVEADGAKRHPVKAPGPHEPVVPGMAGLVIGVIGLDCLGRPMDGATVHRPEHFSTVAGCAMGDPIRPEHLMALARSPQGLFKGTPPGSRRVLLLNKADCCSLEPAVLLGRLQGCGDLPVDLVLVCTLRAPDSRERVLAVMDVLRPAICLAGGSPACP